MTLIKVGLVAAYSSALVLLGLPDAFAAPKSSAPASKPAEQKASKKPGLPIPGGSEMSKLPTFIKASSLVLRGNDRVFAYEGGVEVRQGDLTLTATALEGKYTEKNQIDQLTAKDNVVIVKGENIRATGERAIFENATQTITLTNNPELQQEGSVLTADTIKIFLEENRSVAEGNVRVKLVKKESSGADSPALPGLGSFK
jgi:lipopolysaccharide transport protein LptA